jgi:hypothetical protein
VDLAQVAQVVDHRQVLHPHVNLLVDVAVAGEVFHHHVEGDLVQVRQDYRGLLRDPFRQLRVVLRDVRVGYLQALLVETAHFLDSFQVDVLDALFHVLILVQTELVQKVLERFYYVALCPRVVDPLVQFAFLMLEIDVLFAFFENFLLFVFFFVDFSLEGKGYIVGASCRAVFACEALGAGRLRPSRKCRLECGSFFSWKIKKFLGTSFCWRY